MSLPVATALPGPAVQRQLADYHPSVWGDYFLKYDSDNVGVRPSDDDIRKAVDEVKAKLTGKVDAILDSLELIDHVQHLGVARHFENEIDAKLAELHDLYPGFIDGRNDGSMRLHGVALYFRLLRQQGYNISSEVFDEFRHTGEKFSETLVGDVRGLLSLYQASHMMVHGEDILEEALVFTTAYLKSINEREHSQFLVDLVRRALKQPIRKGLPRLEAWHYIQIYQNNPSHDPVLLSLARMDFHSLQILHQKEVCDIVRWWKDWDFPRNTSFARDRVVECYFWILGVYFEPEYTFARKFLTKLIALTSIMDDMYDAYGTLEELIAYTEALQKWDLSATEGLPGYMQLHYRAILDVYCEAETELASKGRLYRLPYAIQSMKDQAVRYLTEAKWFYQKYKPSLDEYIVLASTTTAYTMLITNSFVGMGDAVTEDAFKWASGNPKMLKASTMVCRLMDDLVSRKFEQKRGHVTSAVECYVKEYGGTEVEAEEALNKMVFDAWKDINEASLMPFDVPAPILTRVLNFTRVIDVLYKDGDNYTHSSTLMKDIICYILVDPLPM
ncbi:hypothetical protein MLD38_024937 [Melastoma candidum]|uniref:Uncharacterized protein n=1 Tax=Melastoma candidum TaxID=119954 RepID=A0ACB9NTJ3_9MYRT|nr:hypothetical protein MLD38_024937 [Melastoma candidum]